VGRVVSIRKVSVESEERQQWPRVKTAEPSRFRLESEPLSCILRW